MFNLIPSSTAKYRFHLMLACLKEKRTQWDVMELSEGVKTLLVEFVSAVISGAVAGLIAGWVIMRSQFSRELALDDSTRLMTLLHLLQDAAGNINEAAYNEAVAMQDGRDTTALSKLVHKYVEEALESLNRVRSQAQFLRAKKYKLLKGYLVLRITRAGDFDLDEFALMRFLQSLAEDIHEYVIKPPSLFRRVKHWYRVTLSEEQKLMLKTGTTFYQPKPWWQFLGSPTLQDVTIDQNKGLALAEDLVKRHLLIEDDFEYQLTREGWKEAVYLLDGKYDVKAGRMLPLT